MKIAKSARSENFVVFVENPVRRSILALWMSVILACFWGGSRAFRTGPPTKTFGGDDPDGCGMVRLSLSVASDDLGGTSFEKFMDSVSIDRLSGVIRA